MFRPTFAADRPVSYWPVLNFGQFSNEVIRIVIADFVRMQGIYYWYYLISRDESMNFKIIKLMEYDCIIDMTIIGDTMFVVEDLTQGLVF